MSCERDQAAFLGRMTAAATHELRNLLAIISESAGLIGDSIASADATTAGPQRLQRALDRISRQVVRGTALLSSLNHLAHCPDHAEAVVDLNREAECLVQLGQRVARQRAAMLQLTQAGTQVSLQLDPLPLQMVLLAAFELLLAQASDGCTITVKVEAGEQPAIELTASGEVSELAGAGGWQQLCSLAAGLPAVVESAGSGRLRLVFAHK